MIAFPIYVCDDAKDVMSFSSLEVMQGYLEPIDVENHEFEAWDGEGRVLKLAVGKPKSEWLKISQSDRTLSQVEFAEIKDKARPYHDPEPLLRRLGRKFRILKS